MREGESTLDEARGTVTGDHLADRQVAALVERYDVAAQVRRYVGPAAAVVAALAAAMSLFHLAAATVLSLHAMTLRAVHLGFVLVLIFLLYPFRYRPGAPAARWPGAVDLVLATLAVGSTGYVVANLDAILVRAGDYTVADFWWGVVAILLSLEAARRATGWLMPALGVIFLLYPWVGHLLPGYFTIRQFDWDRIVTFMYLTTEGLFGLPIGVSATYVFLFVLFGAFLNRTGTGQLFIELAMAALGGSTGGPAKVAVVASGLLGTINGSAIANVAGTGVFTIPLMKRTGYQPHVAGAIEAAASTGGQLMPPVMGAAAFIMAEFIGVPYISIAIAAALPALLYYGSLIAMVHLEAVKTGLRPMSRDDLPKAWPLLRSRGHLLLPIPVVLVFLLQGYTPTYAAVAGIVAALLVAMVRPETRLPLRGYGEALVAGAREAVPVAIACAIIGYVMGATSLTGLGLKIAGAIVALGQGELFPTLVLTMLASIILGTGLPTTATYIVLATMAAPALQQLNVDVIAAHLFIFYYGIIADLTPPIALAAMVGAGIAGADPDRAGWTSTRLALAGWLIPFVFVYSPAMLILNTPPWQVFQATVTGLLGVLALACAVQGHMQRPLRWHERTLTSAAALLLIVPEPVTDLLGAGALALAFALQRRRVL